MWHIHMVPVWIWLAKKVTFAFTLISASTSTDCMYICIYTYTYTCVDIYIYVHIARTYTVVRGDARPRLSLLKFLSPLTHTGHGIHWPTCVEVMVSRQMMINRQACHSCGHDMHRMVAALAYHS